MTRKFLLICAVVFVSCAESLAYKNVYSRKQAKALKIASVSIKHFDEENFKTIGEYFGSKKEHQYFRCIVREDENKRAGTYFIIGFNRSLRKFPRDTVIKISTRVCLRDEVAVREFKIPEKRSKIAYEVYCGVTSALDQANLRAWKVEIVDSSGKVLCHEESYMWH